MKKFLVNCINWDDSSKVVIFLRAELCLLPWPLRLFESEQCVVELVEGSTTDAELSMRLESNYMAVLHRYDSDGTHRKLDVRRIIRKSLRKVCTNTSLPGLISLP